VQIGFADGDGSGGTQAFDYGGVMIRNKVFEYKRTGGGADSARVEQILMGYGNAVQWPAITAFGQLTVALVRFGECLLLCQRDRLLNLSRFFMSAKVCRISSTQEISRLRSRFSNWRMFICGGACIPVVVFS
jgi:hypothetical protein